MKKKKKKQFLIMAADGPQREHNFEEFDVLADAFFVSQQSKRVKVLENNLQNAANQVNIEKNRKIILRIIKQTKKKSVFSFFIFFFFLDGIVAVLFCFKR